MQFPCFGSKTASGCFETQVPTAKKYVTMDEFAHNQSTQLCGCDRSQIRLRIRKLESHNVEILIISREVF